MKELTKEEDELLKKIAKTYAQDPHQADDLISVCYLRYCKTDFSIVEARSTYLRKLFNTTCIDYMRSNLKSLRFRNQMDSKEEMAERMVDDSLSPFTISLLEALSRKLDNQDNIILKEILSGTNHDEIAMKLGIERSVLARRKRLIRNFASDLFL